MVAEHQIRGVVLRLPLARISHKGIVTRSVSKGRSTSCPVLPNRRDSTRSQVERRRQVVVPPSLTFRVSMAGEKCGLAAALIWTFTALTAGSVSIAAERPNVLFIAVDDLRPQLACYGCPGIITPNIDRLASRGTVFNRSYCQAAVCRASRVSLLLGLRPDTTEIWSNGSRHKHFRDHLPDIVTLPQHFKNYGYDCRSLGKIFHGAFVVRNKWNDPVSWSEPGWLPGPRYYYTEEGVNVARRVFAPKAKSLGVSVDEWVDHFVLGLSHEAPEVADNVLYDGQVAEHGMETLRKILPSDRQS